jgi:hypothetical protein
LAVVAVARTLLAPAVSVALTVTSCQVSQFPVGLNATSLPTTVPLTLMSIGRFTVEPFEDRNARL